MVSKATLVSRTGPFRFETSVDGDPRYDARTTRRAVSLLLAETSPVEGHLKLEQEMRVPIGCGFGASSASAISAVYAVAALLGVRTDKARQACFAHRAELIEQTGVGTVSVAYNFTGAGAITVPGEPGAAKFLKVDVPDGMRIVAASLGPYDKRVALSSPLLSRRITELGSSALAEFLARPTLEVLAREGERFSSGLGLMTPEVKKLAEAAKAAGAVHASQNMIGYAVHSLVDADRAAKVEEALSSLGGPRVDVYEVGNVRAGPIGGRSRRVLSRT